MSEKMFRGFVRPPNYDDMRRPWEELDRVQKIQRFIEIMSKSGTVAKRGKASGEDAILTRIEKEDGLATEITHTPSGREAILFFITNIFRSENGGRSFQVADRARKLFSLDETPEEQAEIRDAELDCRAFEIATNPYPDDSWFTGLTEEETTEVQHRAQIIKSKKK